MSPHSQDLHYLLIQVNLIDQAVLNINSPRVFARKVAHELFVWRWSFKRVLGDDLEQYFSFSSQAGSSQFLRVLEGLFCINKLPTHQVNSGEHSSSGAAIPSRKDSRIPGIESRYSVSCIARQSSSEIR